MHFTKITPVSLGVLLLTNNLVFASKEGEVDAPVKELAAAKPDMKDTRSLFPVFELRKKPYVEMDSKENILSGTDTYKIADMLSRLSSEDKRSVMVSVEVPFGTSKEDVAAFKKYGTFMDASHIKMSADQFGAWTTTFFLFAKK